ncbi:MAG: TRAP transporter fused permease subunit [Chloroflexi bacterium]|nr:TRAP transporter fused permease subunit [Chloroflexota bacterium]
MKVFAAAGCLFALLDVAGVFFYFGVFFFRNEFNAIFMATVLVLTFILVPASKKAPRGKVPWYDVLLILGTLAGTVYIVINARELSYYGTLRGTPLEIGLAGITVLVLMEAVRRSFGWAMIIITLAFLLYAKFGYLIPGPLGVYYFSWSMLTSDIYLSFEGVFGSLTGLSGTIIITFVTFGVFFVASGGGKFFLDIALGTTGTMRGGPAKAAVVGSALFGTLSGSPAANVAVTGSVTIPMMKSIGYKPYYAGAIEAIASTGGMIAPPIMGGAAFIMAIMLGTTYASVAMLAFLPAVLYFVSLYVQVHLHACKVGLKGLSREQLPSARMAIAESYELLIPFIILIVLLFIMKYPAELSAIYTIVSLVAVSMFRKRHRITLARFIDSLEGGMRLTLSVANVIALASVILAVLSITGVGLKLSAGLVTFSAGNMLLLVLLAGVACYIMGMGISLTAAFILVAALVAPALKELGLPLVVSHFFILYMVTATNFTPPFCTAAFVASGIAGAPPFRIGFQAMRLGIVTFLVPFIIVYNPALILLGDAGEIVLAAVTAIIGIFGLSVGIEGYLFRHTNWPQRLLFIIGGVVMVVPGVTTDIIGAAMLGIAVFWQWRAALAARRQLQFQ